MGWIDTIGRDPVAFRDQTDVGLIETTGADPVAFGDQTDMGWIEIILTDPGVLQKIRLPQHQFRLTEDSVGYLVCVAVSECGVGWATAAAITLAFSSRGKPGHSCHDGQRPATFCHVQSVMQPTGCILNSSSAMGTHCGRAAVVYCPTWSSRSCYPFLRPWSFVLSRRGRVLAICNQRTRWSLRCPINL